MKIQKVKNVRTPERGTSKSAGLDFFVPENFKGVHFLTNGEDLLIESGIVAEIPKGHALIFKEKSSTSTKHKLHIGACVVDEDYQGEILIHIFNFGNDVAEVQAGMKIAQAVLVPVLCEDVEVVEKINFEISERGDGRLGSTD